MKPSTSAPGGYGVEATSTGARIRGTAAPMSALVGLLQSSAGRTVLDKTNLNGLFDFDVRFAANDLDPLTAQPSGPSLFTAVQEQLGLKLESAKGPGDVFVIDRLEKPAAN